MDKPAPLPSAAEAGSQDDKQKLFASLYVELRGLAQRHLRNGGGLISPTTLLHETYLDIVQGRAAFPDRAHFMAYASRVMRGLIIDFAREGQAQKRGGEFHITRLDDTLARQIPAVQQQDLLRLSEALDELAQREPRLAEVVDLRYFCGFSVAEIAAMRGVALRTVQRDWEKARLLLFHEMGGEQVDPAH